MATGLWHQRACCSKQSILCAIENIVRLLHGYAARNAALHRFRLGIRTYMYVTLMNELVE